MACAAPPSEPDRRISLDEPQNPSIGKVLAHQCHEPIMGNRIEVTFDVNVHDVKMSRL